MNPFFHPTLLQVSASPSFLLAILWWQLAIVSAKLTTYPWWKHSRLLKHINEGAFGSKLMHRPLFRWSMAPSNNHWPWQLQAIISDIRLFLTNCSMSCIYKWLPENTIMISLQFSTFETDHCSANNMISLQTSKVIYAHSKLRWRS